MATALIIALIVVLVVIIAVIIWVIAGYNGLVKAKNNVEEGFSTMDVYLKKRYDLIPNLVETVRGYAEHESQTLQQVISAKECGAKRDYGRRKNPGGERPFWFAAESLRTVRRISGSEGKCRLCRAAGPAAPSGGGYCQCAEILQRGGQDLQQQVRDVSGQHPCGHFSLREKAHV